MLDNELARNLSVLLDEKVLRTTDNQLQVLTSRQNADLLSVERGGTDVILALLESASGGLDKIKGLSRIESVARLELAGSEIETKATANSLEVASATNDFGVVTTGVALDKEELVPSVNPVSCRNVERIISLKSLTKRCQCSKQAGD